VRGMARALRCGLPTLPATDRVAGARAAPPRRRSRRGPTQAKKPKVFFRQVLSACLAPAFVPKPNCHLSDGAPSPCVTLTAPLVKSAVDSVHNLGARRYGRTGVVTRATVKAQAGLPAHGLL